MFLVPFTVALVLGATGITRQTWRDEHATWWAATIPWSSLADLLSKMDVVLAPYYLFMRGWIAVFGDSAVAMRVPSLLAMATAAGLTGVLGARLYTPWIGVTAGTMLALIPSVSRYAQEARPYAFAMCFAICTILALLSRRWALLAIFVTLTGWAHLIALSVLVAHLPLLRDKDQTGARVTAPDVAVPDGAAHNAIAVGVALPTSGEAGGALTGGGAVGGALTGGAAGVGGRAANWPLRRWIAAVAVGLVPVLPLVVLGARQTGQVSWIDASWKSLVMLPVALTRSAVTAGLLAGLVSLGLLAGRRIGFLAAWAIVPPLLVFVFTPQFFYYRYLLFTLPAWALLAAIGASAAVRSLGTRRQAVAAVAICFALLLLGARDHRALRRSPLAGDQDYAAAARYVGDHLRADDSITFAGYADQRERYGFAYQLRRRTAPTICPDPASCAGRVWLVTNSPAALVPPGFTVLDAQRFPGLQVALLRR